MSKKQDQWDPTLETAAVRRTQNHPFAQDSAPSGISPP